MKNIVWKKNCPKCGCEQTYSRKSFLLHSIRENKQCRKCMFNSDEYKQKHIINSKNMWADDIKRNEIVKKRNTIEAKQKWSKSSFVSMNAVEYKKRQSNLQKELLNLYPDRIEVNRQNIKRMWDDKSSVYHTDEFRKKLSDGTKQMWKNPITRKKMYDALSKTKWIKVRSDIGQLELIEKWNKLGFNFELNYQLCYNNFLCYIDGYDKEKNVVIEYDSNYHQKSIQKQKDKTRQQKIIEILKPKKFWRYDSKNKIWNYVLEGKD